MSGDYLYHGSSKMLDELRPSDRLQIRNGETGKWTFATHLRSHAIPYTFSGLATGRERWRLMSTREDEPGKALTVVYTEDAKHFRDGFVGYLHRIPREGFMRVARDGQPTNEWVSRKPVRVDTSLSETFFSFEQVMGEGVQLFSSTRRRTDAQMLAAFEAQPDIHEACGQMMRSGDLAWENGVRGIGMAPEFSQCSAARVVPMRPRPKATP